MRLTIFSWKSPKKVLDLLKDTQTSPSPWFNVVPRLEKLCHAVVVRNDQANLQSTLKKEAGGASLTIFVTDSIQDLKNKLKRFFKDPENVFQKGGLSLRRDYRKIFIGWIWGFLVHLSLKTLPVSNRKI